MDSAYARWARAALNNLCFQDDLNVLLFPFAWDQGEHLLHAVRVDQKFSGRDGATSSDAGSDHHILIRIGVQQPGHYRVILVRPGMLLHGSI